jgi:RNA polymerase sigma-70 factor (ECF subfamily)
MNDDRLTRLYRAYGRVIYVRCRSMLADERAAEDATQETFSRVFARLDRVPDDRAALFWIYRVATNVCLNELRRRRRRPEAVASPTAAAAPASLDPESLLVDRAVVASLVAEAPEELGVVAWLHYRDGFEQAEIAEIVGVSRRTVASRLAEFLRRARKMVGRN